MIDFFNEVKLGTLDRDMIDKLRSWRNDPRIWLWCRQNDLLTQSSHEAWFEAQAKDPTIRMYSILSTECELRGVCGLTSIDLLNRRAEFSLYVAREFQGLGIAKRALQTLVSHGFSNYGLNSIWGESFDGNTAIEMFKTLGFSHEGTRREAYYKADKFCDAHLFSILRSEWLKSDQFNKDQKWN